MSVCLSGKSYETLADIILCSEAPSQSPSLPLSADLDLHSVLTLTSNHPDALSTSALGFLLYKLTVQKIVNAAAELDGKDMPKISLWFRCLFQIAIRSEIVMAEQLLDQVMTIAKACQAVILPTLTIFVADEAQNPSSYPPRRLSGSGSQRRR